jgi:hypothetical protein
MKKAEQKRLDESLNKALEPPRKRPAQNLDALLETYNDGLPNYRSTAVPEQAQVVDAKELLPEYRSTPVPEPIVPTERFYKKANEYADRLDRTLSPAESKVLEHLLRFTVGFNRDTIRVRVSVLMERTGYKSDKTVRAALRSLELKRRIERLSSVNSPLGDEYQILPYSGNTGVPQYRSTAVENTAVLGSKITGELKTVLKDKELDDDAALAGLVAELKVATKDLTGKEVSMLESDRWRELAQVLVAELKIAAGRTNVSSVPSFLAEHLRRRLWKMDKKQARAEGRELPDEAVSKPQDAADASSCPDCSGSGWWYPEGPDKGVKKCKHDKMQQG